MRSLQAVVRSLALVALLLAAGAGVLPADQVSAQTNDRITVTVTVYDFDATVDDPSVFPNVYTYGQSGPPEWDALTPAAAGSVTVLAFAEDGPIIGRGLVDANGVATLEIAAGPFFIILSGDIDTGSYVDPGTADTNWTAIVNPAAGPVTDPNEEPAGDATGATGQGDGPGGGAIAELAIAAYACPSGYTVPDADPVGGTTATCVSPAVGVDFSVRPRAFEAQPTILTSGAGGDAVAGLAASDLGYDVQITLPTAALGYIVTCTQADGDNAGTVYTAGGFQVQSAGETGDRIGCDVFFVFAGNGSGTSPAPSAVASSAPSAGTTPGASSAPVTGLPNTGAGTSAPMGTSLVMAALMLLAAVSVAAGLVARARRVRLD